MTLRQKQSLFAFNIHKLIEFAYKNGFELTFGESTRTPSQIILNFFGYDVVQRSDGPTLVKRPRTSKTLESRHGVRLAVDFNIFIGDRLTNSPKEIKPLGDFWESLHTDNVWGGDWDRDDNLDEETFTDPYHFEMKP